jgi:hypothetical protein
MFKEKAIVPLVLEQRQRLRSYCFIYNKANTNYRLPQRFIGA